MRIQGKCIIDSYSHRKVQTKRVYRKMASRVVGLRQHLELDQTVPDITFLEHTPQLESVSHELYYELNGRRYPERS